MMPLFWIVHEFDGKRRIYIQEARSLFFARRRASRAGFKEGTFVDAVALDAEMAKKIPKALIGRILSPSEVSTLLPWLS